MGSIKHIMQEDLAKGVIQTPSHLDKEMHEELIKLNKQVNAIKQILEDANEKHTDDSNTSTMFNRM
tara:strand:- start:650 stop:847 length:198 start_codon:yes stop_codon:yes gene_type:complete